MDDNFNHALDYFSKFEIIYSNEHINIGYNNFFE
jgi:hypothetical protein